jgi:hypothetical protein
LLDASFIKEVYNPSWLANPVLVPKKNRDWRMCVDYTDLNKACKKDPFGLPRIDHVRFPSKKKTKSKHPSSHRSLPFVIQRCCSDTKVQVQCTKGVYNGVYTLNMGVMLKHMLTIWSSILRKTRDSSLTCQRPLTI